MHKNNSKRGQEPGPSPRKTPMDTALRYLASRARTVREMELHLDSKQYGEFEVQQTVDRLLELGYLDDVKYAEDFIQTRLNTKPVSRYKLQEQLLGHALPKQLVEEALASIDDETEWAHALQVAQKYLPQIPEGTAYEREQRLAKRLHGRGFSGEMSLKAAREALQEEAADA